MLSTKHLLVVTGASRGFGRALTLAYVRFLLESEADIELEIILVARSLPGLEESERQVRALLSHNSKVTFLLLPLDLQKHEDIDKLVKESEAATTSRYKTAILFNNVGSLPNISLKVSDYKEWESTGPYWNLNVISVLAISSWFVRKARESCDDKAYIINTSSLLAIKAFPFWNMYSIAKSARDMIHAQIASEEDSDKILTLNYAPGPLNNDMMEDVLNTLGDPSAVEYYKSLKREGKLVPEADSAGKVIHLLKKGFSSGSHVDFYDV